MEGTPFGRYQLIDLRGRGGMGEVWRAFDTVTERMVAIKVLPGQYGDDEVYQTRFRREAKAAAGLNDPHVVPIYDFGEIGGRLFVAMRLVEGEDLQSIIVRGPVKPDRAVGIVEQIAGALHAAHRIDLVHRDVKPHNILIAEDDFAYLIDFGIARAAGETGLTTAGATLGTWAYMAPERFQTGLADARADTYALAVVLYQALTGELPFPSISVEQVALAHIMTPPPAPSAARSDIPPAMDAVIATGMAKDPGLRYPTAKDLAAAARSALASTEARTVHLVPLPTPPPPQPATTRFTPPPPDQSSTVLRAPHAQLPRDPYVTPPPAQASPNDPTQYGLPRLGPPAAPAYPAALEPSDAPPAPSATSRNKTAIIAVAATVSVLLLVGLALFAFTSVFDGGGATSTTTSDATTEAEATASETSASDATTTAKTPSGEATADGDFTFAVASTDTGDTVTSSKDSKTQKTATGQFFVVYLTVTNSGSAEASFPSSLQVLNADGTTFSPDEEASTFLGGGPLTVGPGVQVEIPVVFDVPVGTTPTSIRVHGATDGDGVELPL